MNATSWTSSSYANSDTGADASRSAGNTAAQRKKTARAGNLYVGSESVRPAAKICASFPGSRSPPEQSTEFHTVPEKVLHDVTVPYFCLEQREDGLMDVDAAMLLSHTPLPKGSSAFTSVHIVSVANDRARATSEIVRETASKLRGDAWTYEWPELEAGDVVGEYEAFFRITSELVLNGADRSSLLVFVANAGDTCELAVATILAMLPFRGVQVAFVTPRLGYVNPLRKMTTASGLFEYDARQPERMGRCPVAAVFGPLGDRSFCCALARWRPLKPAVVAEEKPAPFKIGALELPMVTFEGRYAAGVDRLASLLETHFGTSMFPVVAVGETVDALGYGSDVFSELEHRGCSGYYFTHASGESNKKPEAYGSPEFLKAIAAAKGAEKRVVVIAVGGGVNGNTIGTVAAMIGADFVEVPTTLMHYNDATTSAKKAFSLVRDGQILSKNILGTFYLPKLVFCISETFLTLCPNSVHAAVGEATKTMSMLGNTASTTGQQNFSNILGGVEFASDFTRIMGGVEGFEHLIRFIRDSRELKDEVLRLGRQIAEARRSVQPGAELARLAARREEALAELRARFHGGISAEARDGIISFLTVINEEIIRAKAMFLAYSDPFEKYRALLFEYAHTLGHGIEAVMNGLYRKAEAQNIDYEDAFRLHGQCVGMSVVLAGEMSRRLGHLQGDGFVAHQSLVYLFNSFGGYDFRPLRELCDKLGVSREEFCESVLKVVRRDNKRGYCKCAAGCSVDQLVQGRPGSLLRSDDPSAELRYLVEVSEDSQRDVLMDAFEGHFDNVLVAEGPGQLSHVPHAQASKRDAAYAAEELRVLLRALDGDGGDLRSSGAGEAAVTGAGSSREGRVGRSAFRSTSSPGTTQSVHKKQSNVSLSTMVLDGVTPSNNVASPSDPGDGQISSDSTQSLHDVERASQGSDRKRLDSDELSRAPGQWVLSADLFGAEKDRV
jgi:3-dehydroquinate synthetase